MFQIKNFKYSFIFFYCFGQAPYFPLQRRAQKSSWLLKFLPLIVLICVFLGSGYVVFHNYLKPQNRTNNVLSYMLTFLTYAPNVSVIYENVIDPYGVTYLNRGLISIDKFTKDKLNGNSACTEKFQTIYKQVVIIMFVCYLVNTSVRCNILSPFKNEQAELSLSIMNLYKVCSFIHAIFYLYAIRFMFLSINTKIDDKDFESTIEMCSMLGGEFERSMNDTLLYFDRLQLYYFKLWEVITIFNERFGWSLLALIIDSIISAVHAIYWLFVYPSSMDNGIYLIWRKYFFYFFD